MNYVIGVIVLLGSAFVLIVASYFLNAVIGVFVKAYGEVPDCFVLLNGGSPEHKNWQGNIQWVVPLIEPGKKRKLNFNPKGFIRIERDNGVIRDFYYHGKRCLNKFAFPVELKTRKRYFELYPEKREYIMKLLGIDPVEFELKWLNKQQNRHIGSLF